MTRVCEEYAAALFMLASEEQVKNEVHESCEAIKTAVCENPEFIDLLATPSIPLDERCDVIDKAFSSLHEYAVSFVKLLCERGHIRELCDCIDEFIKLHDAADGTSTAYVTSALPLTDTEKSALAAKLQAKLSRRVELVCDVDASLLGGVIVRVDGNVIDGSLRTRLSEVKDTISR